VRAVTSGLRRCGDWATKAVGDRDGKSSDDTSRHPSRPQLQLQHRSVDVKHFDVTFRPSRQGSPG
jgi:hypothetical protein